MGRLSAFLFSGDEEEGKPKKSGRVKKPGPGGGRKPPPKKTKTKAGKADDKPPTRGRKGSAMPVKTAADLERQLKARKKSNGNVEDQALEYFKLWRRKKSDDDKADVIEMLKAEKGFKQIKKYLPDEMLAALEGGGDNAGAKGSATKLPKGMDKAAYTAAKAKAEQLKGEGKTQDEIVGEFARENVDPDITNYVITEVFS